MIMTISLTARRADISLETEGSSVDTLVFPVDNDLSNHLLSNIDAMLRRNQVDPLSLERVDFHAESAGFTTTRIGQTVANAYNFALRGNRHER